MSTGPDRPFKTRSLAVFQVHPCHPWRGFHGFDNPQPQHPCCVVRREKDTLSVFFCFRLTLVRLPSAVHADDSLERPVRTCHNSVSSVAKN